MNSYNQLPENFTPGDHDVVIGKGKKYFFHKGNAMLRGLAASMLNEYASAKTKLDKSLIISDVAEHVRQNGNFVKRDNASERWVVAEDLLCREKISAVFRDALHQRCRPSGSSFTKRTEEKRRALTSPQPHAPFQWKIKVPPPTFGLSAASMSSEMPQLPQAALMAAVTPSQHMPPLTSALTNGQGDIFSIFSSALANINEEGDPFEPKPLCEQKGLFEPKSIFEAIEPHASASNSSALRETPYCLSPGPRAA